MTSNNQSSYHSSLMVTISPHDPLVIRDGRPFSAGGEGANRARSLDWPYPSTVSGAIRNLVGHIAAQNGLVNGNPFRNPNFVDRLKNIAVCGPLACKNDRLYVPAPRDGLAFAATNSGEQTGREKQQGKAGELEWVRLRPAQLRPGEGCDLPYSGILSPILVPRQEKPARMPAFWSIADAVQWLANDGEAADVPGPREVLDGFDREERIHVRIDPQTQTADDSQLFSTQGLIFPFGTGLVALVDPGEAALNELITNLQILHPLGGERRLAYFAVQPTDSRWQSPREIQTVLLRATGVRMQLATPAIFSRGWLPGWLDPTTLEGAPPGVSEVRLRLRGACVERWRPVSGWDLERHRPKPLRRVVPAGSVYFFEVVGGSPERLADVWLRPVADSEQDRRDGFGLALWGVWRNKGGSAR
ncbi:MAG: type III-B CRISPR module-associated protein Cmr3 [Limnochordaceae bacterium]|nr:type III-B CRISPR module-associated protein Cmr3 [Limnochordaceae bacterium]